MKILLNVKIKNKEEEIEEEVKAIFLEKKNVIKYIETTGTKVIFFKSEKKLTRENESLVMEYLFNEGKGKVSIKDLKKTMLVDIKVKEIKETDKEIKIKYEIEDNKFVYMLKWRAL